VNPYYLADYLRAGFGQDQIQRLYTGSTGLIELTAEHVDRVVVSTRSGVDEQSQLSAALREAESGYREQLSSADAALEEARNAFEEQSIS
jgi:type I restriction enzyme M protein